MIGFAFRDKGLISNLSLIQNVDLPARYHGGYRAEDRGGSLAENALKELGVDAALWPLRPSRISWEVRKKVLFARAIVLSPKLLLLDDPSALMASPSLPGLISWIRAQARRGTAILVGTNDYPIGIAVADWVLHPIANYPVNDCAEFIGDAWMQSARLLASQAAGVV